MTTPTDTCLDAETLAAWADGGLNRTDAAMAEAHVSSCPRCQAIAGLIVKTMPPPIADAPWWRRRAAWLVPVSVGVAAVGLLMIAPTDPAPRPAAPPVTAPPVTAAPVTAPVDSTQKAATPPAAPSLGARPTETAVAQTKPAPARSPKAKKERQRDEGANVKVEANPAPVAAAERAVPPAAANAVAGRVADQKLSRESLGAVAGKQAVSPDGALHWRITERGAVERSTDAGTSWQAVNVGVTATFTTVQAPEPRTALVTTTDGRVFRTADGGATWHVQEI